MRTLLLLFIPWCAFGQAPQVLPDGVVNAASWTSPVAPGSLVSIFGTNLAAAPQSAGAPFPLTLGGTSVTINGVAAPLAFVSPGQINAQVPAGLPVQAGFNIGTADVVVTTAAGSTAPAKMGLTASWPGFFTADGSGCGQAAALNAIFGGESTNSASQSAAPGDYVSLFGTGFGLAAQQPADGTAVAGPDSLPTPPAVSVDNQPITNLSYAGLAPTLPGVDQVNFQIPAGTRNGCAVPVTASQVFGSPTVTISVQQGRGQCTDPPIESYGQISLTKSVLNGQAAFTATSSEFVSASFPSGPAVRAPAAPVIVLAPEYVANAGVGSVVAFLSAGPIIFRSCAVPGYSHLSAGAIQIQPPAGNAITMPTQAQSDGVSYGLTLSAGFIGPGSYSISGTAGNTVGLQSTSVKIGSPITVTSSLAAGTVISSGKPFTVTWTGGDAGTLVKVSLISGGVSSYSYTDAANGSLTMAPVCPPVGTCSFGIPPSTSAQVSVVVSPAPDKVTTVHVPGVTGPVQLSWQYSYAWLGLTLSD